MYGIWGIGLSKLNILEPQKKLSLKFDLNHIVPVSLISSIIVVNRNKAEEDSLYALPENLKVQSSNKRTEDMLSNQMLSGIPEIDLGIE